MLLLRLEVEIEKKESDIWALGRERNEGATFSVEGREEGL